MRKATSLGSFLIKTSASIFREMNPRNKNIGDLLTPTYYTKYSLLSTLYKKPSQIEKAFGEK